MRKMQKNEFSTVYQIMEEAFPAEERRTRCGQEILLTESDYQIDVETTDNLVYAFLASWKLPHFTYIEHFAVQPKLRNCGTGHQMLQQFVRQHEKVVLEVELPENETADRRIKFYERNGFIQNAYEYLQPPLTKGGDTVPLMVMSFGASLSRKEFEQFRQEVYQKVYHLTEM
ncbi:MAG: GNAT family N-acetyltransferase [Oscillospiraceae bacterium]|jgi:ribosomal protein S18 acetylase RimI-like enzyme|nr:GNAT family N-acetyltransferase [Oscillospiraceae bacterium]